MPKYLEIPCELGETVYVVLKRCSPPFGYCALEGGYGLERCYDSGHRCDAYIKAVKFAPYLIGSTVYLTREEAEQALEGLSDEERYKCGKRKL